MIQLPRLGRSISSCDTYAFLLLQFRQDEPDVSQEKLQQIVLIKGSCPTALWKGNAGSLKIAKAHFRYFRVFFLACWPVFVKLGTRGRLADSCIATYYVAPKFPDKSPPAKAALVYMVKTWCVLSSFFPFLFLSCSFLLSTYQYSFPLPRMGGWGVWRDGGQTHCQCLPMPGSIFLIWLQAFLFHRERSAKEVVLAWIARKPPSLWPRK